MIFADRLAAGRELAAALAQWRGKRPIVYAIPRGAVPMGKVVADALDGELDVVLTRKLQLDGYPGATGRRYGAPIGQVAEEVDGVLEGRGWSILSRPEATGDVTEITIEAVAKSFLLGFPSDVAIRLIDEGTSTYVDMRSASRYGDYDLGDNAARMTWRCIYICMRLKP